MDLKIIRIQIYSPGLKAKLSFIFMIIHSLLKQNINHASGEGNENDKKKINTLFILFQNIVFWARRGVGRIFPNFPNPPSSLQRSKPVSGVLIINCF